MDREQEMRKMRNQGVSYREIGEKFGLSKQRIYQIIGESNGYYRYITEEQCAYIGIREWLNHNKVNVTEFCRRVYGKYFTATYFRFTQCLRGKYHFKKPMIDKILSLTGLTYEEAFKEKDNERV